MRLALLRHGIAEDEAVSDHERHLTTQGALEVERLVYTLRHQGWAPGVILHSPLVRTTETAAIVHRHYPGVERRAEPVVAHGSLDAILELAAHHPDPVLVGHQPTMGRLAARIIGAAPGSLPLERGAFALFEVDLPLLRAGRLVLFTPPPRPGLL